MLLKEVDKPFQNKDYLYELKYDGIRVLLYASKDNLKIITRNGNDVTNLYQELLSIKDLVGNKKVIFDGEIVAFQNKKPSFQQLQLRSHLKNKDKIKHMMDVVPVAFIAFDILYQDKDLMNLKLMNRKKILSTYIDTDVFIKTKVYENGLELFKKVKKLGLEGIVAKEKDSLYYPSSRQDCWLKIKNFKEESFIIHGYMKLKEKYSLLLGEYRDNTLYYVGKVSVIEKNPILKQIKKLKKSKNQFANYFIDANYVEPKCNIIVHYMERTKSNTLRQPFIKNKKTQIVK